MPSTFFLCLNTISASEGLPQTSTTSASNEDLGLRRPQRTMSLHAFLLALPCFLRSSPVILARVRLFLERKRALR